MLIGKTFVVELWEETGQYGFKAEDMPHADPSRYEIALPHDILEHFGSGDVEDELKACGAMIYTRALPGWFSQNNRYYPDPVYNISN